MNNNKTISSGHGLIEDLGSILQASVIFAIGVMFLESAGLITGGTTGISLILSYITDYSFGFWFTVVNAPFFALAYLRMGKKFTIMTTISILLVSIIVEWFNSIIAINIEYRPLSSALSGLFIGIGLLILFRHRSSMGGFTILSLYLQDNFKISAGKLLLIFDLITMAFGFYLYDILTIIYSLIGLLVLNIVLIVNHKQGRYSPNKN